MKSSKAAYGQLTSACLLSPYAFSSSFQKHSARSVIYFLLGFVPLTIDVILAENALTAFFVEDISKAFFIFLFGFSVLSDIYFMRKAFDEIEPAFLCRLGSIFASLPITASALIALPCFIASEWVIPASVAGGSLFRLITPSKPKYALVYAIIALTVLFITVCTMLLLGYKSSMIAAMPTATGLWPSAAEKVKTLIKAVIARW